MDSYLIRLRELCGENNFSGQLDDFQKGLDCLRAMQQKGMSRKNIIKRIFNTDSTATLLPPDELLEEGVCGIEFSHAILNV